MTFDGEPIEMGDILFVPEDADAATDAGSIRGGTYHLEATAGAKRVEIRAIREIPGKLVEDGANPGKKRAAEEEFIPAQFNSESRLTVDVATNGSQTFDFNLESHD
ncbi:hypothetical protein [Planctomycetes bacterium Pan216]|uniref:hypothetical protein n=1 Tax=Kolteria novifilia TaxID=2527975 RepID=UPI0011A058A2